VSPSELRRRLREGGRESKRVAILIGEVGGEDLSAAIRDLGGHDLNALLEGLEEADAAKDRPSVVFAYTIKGWRLPVEGHPANHSALLSEDQVRGLARSLGADPAEPWAPFPDDSPAAHWCGKRAARLQREPPPRTAAPRVPVEFGRPHRGRESTQQAFGRFLSDLNREAEEVSRRVVTVSPDVASSTNLGGWINRVGIWSTGDRIDWFADDTDTLVRWREITHGQHIELGIAETNLVGLLGELGIAWQVESEPLLPIGTLYDPFVGRALEPWSFGIYGGGQSILVGTPSGITLASEGGAHQSIVTPAIGIAQPGCAFWEPAFAQDFEWAFLHALSRLGRADGTTSYFRLSTRPIEQELSNPPSDEPSRDLRRAQVLAGGYRLRESSSSGPGVALVGMGAVIPEVVRAADVLEAAGIPVDAVCVTSADRLFRAARADRGFASQGVGFLSEILPRGWPLVTVLDGHPSALAFLGAALGVPATSLGATDFGQSGDQPDLYEHYGIDSESIIGAALDLVGAQ
jgi:pyruvate dehydrogenase E1 component